MPSGPSTVAVLVWGYGSHHTHMHERVREAQEARRGSSIIKTDPISPFESVRVYACVHAHARIRTDSLNKTKIVAGKGVQVWKTYLEANWG